MIATWKIERASHMVDTDWRIHKRLNNYKTVYIYCGRGSNKPLTDLKTILEFSERGYRVVVNNKFNREENSYEF